MPEYEYVCNGCVQLLTVTASMSDDHTPPPCPACGGVTRRVFSSAFHCDEVRGVKYFDPNKKHEVKDHGKVFDIGLGKWYETKQQRRQLIKDAGFKEHGIREV